MCLLDRLGAVGEEDARYVPTLHLLLVTSVAVADHRAKIVAGQGHPRLG
jgi:hypothetical protein